MNFSSEKILVVDDQPVNVQLLKRKLEREGLAVETAFSGQEALDLVAKNLPSLILLDVMMPDMDGIEVCRRLQASEATRAIPIIFVTARGAREPAGRERSLVRPAARRNRRRGRAWERGVRP